jgi:hypothetical protein
MDGLSRAGPKARLTHALPFPSRTARLHQSICTISQPPLVSLPSPSPSSPAGQRQGLARRRRQGLARPEEAGARRPGGGRGSPARRRQGLAGRRRQGLARPEEAGARPPRGRGSPAGGGRGSPAAGGRGSLAQRQGLLRCQVRLLLLARSLLLLAQLKGTSLNI